MNDILDAMSARIKAPWFGYAVLAFIAINWRGMFLLATTEGAPLVRLAAFDAATSPWTLFVWPLAAGVVATAATPWTRFLFAWLAKKPFEHIDDLQIESEHRRTVRKTELEQSRSALLATQEAEIIERAMRDVEVQKISDAEVKERAEAQLEALRQKRDFESRRDEGELWSDRLSSTELDLLKQATKDGSGSIMRVEYIGGRRLQAGGVAFGMKGTREFLRYESALESLLKWGLVKQLGELTYELTHEGWIVAESL
ncbi:hypothetical protein SSKA14_2117 [Stenotrophomonas sp. SKA14]|uniref:hypothetical protein n=1 Tax=Stenotrophomonas TaxID=40323 RepID=UPI00018FF5D1|nr:hypothetical protein [Stenotrophomonas sp. SKA14]EED39101.1 hypothetical protein SSKA14_2117 [Stenotrophomonas sp. SKA14]